jgi:8-oxo-dGTP pyrophosphatase MutT (NUDIX family)
MPPDQQGKKREAEAGLTRLQRTQIRILHFYFRFARGVTLGVRAVVLNDRGEVFLIRHTYTPGWQFPGGGVEVGETLAEALARELGEEARISLTAPPELHGVFFNRNVSSRDHVAVYVVRGFTVDEVKTPDLEIAEAGFFPLTALPAGVTPATRRRLDEIASGARPATDW